MEWGYFNSAHHNPDQRETHHCKATHAGRTQSVGTPVGAQRGSWPRAWRCEPEICSHLLGRSVWPAPQPHQYHSSQHAHAHRHPQLSSSANTGTKEIFLAHRLPQHEGVTASRCGAALSTGKGTHHRLTFSYQCPSYFCL